MSSNAARANALKRLEAVKAEKQEHITRVLIQNDEKEAQRRRKEDGLISLRQQKREAELESTRITQAKADMRWNSIAQRTDPLSMHDDIGKNKELYESILQSKDNLIADLRAMLEDKDHQYMSSLAAQRQDIDNMLTSMRETYRELATSYEDELEKLEAGFDKEREELLTQLHAEIDSLLDRRRKAEVAQIKVIRETRERQVESLEKMRQRASEEYNSQTITLERQIEDLEEFHAETRATVQLNQQKLQYNVKVLGARAKENSLTKSTQQAKAARVAEALSSIKEKLAKTTQEYKEQNQKLTEEYKRVTENFKELQSKFRHFELTDERQFEELYQLHEEEILALARKVLQADKIITEQQLGMKWEAPVMKEDEGEKDELEEEKKEEEEGEGEGALAEEGDGEEEEGEGEGEEEEGDAEFTARTNAERIIAASQSPDLVHAMLDLIREECGFLAAGVSIPADLDAEQRKIVEIDEILKALNIHTAVQLNRLLNFFLVDPSTSHTKGRETRDSKRPKTQSSQMEEPQTDRSDITSRLIPRRDVVNAVKAFTEEMQHAEAKSSGLGATAMGATTDGLAATTDPSSSPSSSSSSSSSGPGAPGRAKLPPKPVYFAAAREVITEEKLRLWKVLSRESERYNQVLQDRSMLIEKAAALRQQNEELKMLLNQYLSSKTNLELLDPPAHVYRMTEQIAPDALPHS